ncbi:hypothetical protein [Bacillus thuringiensis]|uniref:hypothetical protein n=1 Tax=Bacillus thuringiensis TaxID=1428 RepID=UPI000B411C66|nr:hypothetical protein [Bacillus thuringiensis]ARX69758.1 hypothetical protein BVH75_28650 [Bacillus thuringiensis]MEB9695179.1 hypothetical protein [Bacillus cereus]
MKINIKVETKKEKYSVGDIIVTNSNETHFIYKDPATSRYSLLNCNMDTWASGSFETMDKLFEDMRSWTNFKHYPKSKYQLELVPTN